MADTEYPAEALEQQFGLAVEVANARYANLVLPRSELRRLQEKKLRELVAFAKSHSPFYRRLYKNVDENSFKLQGLPTINKEIVMSEFDEVVTDSRCSLQEIEDFMKDDPRPVFRNEIQIRRTSGTSGFRGLFIYDNHGWAHVISTFLHTFPNTASISLDQKVGTFVSKHQVDVSQSVLPFLKKLGIRILETHYEDPIAECLPRLNTFQPDILSGYSYSIQMLCHEQLAGNLTIRPKVVYCGGETCSEAMKMLWRDVWGAEIFETYGASESVFIARECGQHGLHIYEDLNILEVVDEVDKPVPEGQPGYKVLLTRLYNNLQPLIRYELPDSLIVSTSPCPCGCTFSIIEKIAGKSDDISYFLDHSGRRIAVHPNIFREAVENIPGIRRYRFIIKDDTIHIKIIHGPHADKSDTANLLSAGIRKRLRELGLTTAPGITVERVRDLPNMGLIKDKNVISRGGRPEAPIGRD